MQVLVVFYIGAVQLAACGLPVALDRLNCSFWSGCWSSPFASLLLPMGVPGLPLPSIASAACPSPGAGGVVKPAGLREPTAGGLGETQRLQSALCWCGAVGFACCIVGGGGRHPMGPNCTSRPCMQGACGVWHVTASEPWGVSGAHVHYTSGFMYTGGLCSVVMYGQGVTKLRRWQRPAHAHTTYTLHMCLTCISELPEPDAVTSLGSLFQHLEVRS